MNLAKALREEMQRLARGEVRPESMALRKSLALLRGQVAKIRAELTALGKAQRELSRRTPKAVAVKPKPGVHRFVRKGLTALRHRLGLSAESMGLLLEVSGQSVYNYEAGTTAPSKGVVARIASVRSMSKREATELVAKHRASKTARKPR